MNISRFYMLAALFFVSACGVEGQADYAHSDTGSEHSHRVAHGDMTPVLQTTNSWCDLLAASVGSKGSYCGNQDDITTCQTCYQNFFDIDCEWWDTPDDFEDYMHVCIERGGNDPDDHNGNWGEFEMP